MDTPPCRVKNPCAMPFAPSRDGGVDAVLVDIDHSPTRLLDGDHAGFYTPEGLRDYIAQIKLLLGGGMIP